MKWQSLSGSVPIMKGISARQLHNAPAARAAREPASARGGRIQASIVLQKRRAVRQSETMFVYAPTMDFRRAILNPGRRA
jgi:hypothetical protein